MTTVPDLAEPVVGWRMWQVVDTGGGPEIVSPVRPVTWSPRRTMTAVCDRGCRVVPTPACGCGLYALTDPAALFPQGVGQGRVVGCTALWGRVAEYSRGFRAEHGYPLVLFVRTDLRASALQRIRRRRGLPDTGAEQAPADLLAQDLAARYGVPVGVLEGGSGPSPPMDVERARALGREATRGLTDRRAGDLTAHERLAAAAQDLFGGDEWYAPAA